MSQDVLVFVEHQNGKVSRPAWEALAAGQNLARDLAGHVLAVIVGHEISGLAADVSSAALQEVITADSAQLAVYTSDGTVQALRAVILQKNPAYVVFSHTYEVRDFAPKLAASLDAGLISDCLGYRMEDGGLRFVRQVFQGKFSADVTFAGEGTHLVSFQAAAFREDSLERTSAPSKITPVSVEISQESIRTKPGERFREAKQAVDLSQAEVIVAVGRGIKAPENLELAQKLAAALGAEVGASRPICDSGWLPMDRQIGSSGQTVAPKLYVSLGISGAIQHQVGMKGSHTVVAINKDREAPIFEVATYGVVADLFEIVPPLIEEIKKAKS